MVDLKNQYLNMQEEIDTAILDCVRSTKYINGPQVKSFQNHLEQYLNVKHVIPCANGTDALQIALMALGLKPGDEVIVPAFTYVASAEVIGLLNLHPVMVDVDSHSFNTTAELIEPYITEKTKVVVPVHLYGQCADMQSIMALAKKHNLAVIEDTAQAIGATYAFENGERMSAGCIGDIGTTSFFPSKNLGCYGDGGAMFTNDDELAAKCRMIANHGQKKKYYHSVIGCNSRLDSIQAAILNVKLKYLNDYVESRQAVADGYDKALHNIESIAIPHRSNNSTHVFHQYTLRIKDGRRDELKEYLQSNDIPAMIYYPLPLYDQEAFMTYHDGQRLQTTDLLCSQVISLPIHTEMDADTHNYIIDQVNSFFNI